MLSLYSISVHALSCIHIMPTDNGGQSSHSLINVDYHAPLPPPMIVIKAQAIRQI